MAVSRKALTVGPIEPRFAKALSAAWSDRGLSVSTDDWPGVVASGDGWRVVLPRNASGYVLQRKHGRSKWFPVYGLSSDLGKWAAALGASCPGLGAALKQLPPCSSQAVKALMISQGVPFPDVQRRAYWRAADYPGVLRTDANMRSVRDGSGTVYAVQWVKPAALVVGKPLEWITQASGPSWPGLVHSLCDKTFFASAVQTDREAVGLRLAGLFEGFPEFAAQGAWNRSIALPICCAS